MTSGVAREGGQPIDRAMNTVRSACAALLGVALLSGAAPAAEPERFATFDQVAVGIAASRDGRVFVAFSRAIDPTVKLSVAEVKDGRPRPYPAGLKQDDGRPAADRLLSVQALTVDAANRLWILDCARVGASAVPPGAAKLVAVDLATNQVVKRVSFPPEIAGKGSFLNDLRVDLGRGARGVIYLTDASPEGPNGIVVVDIATGSVVRRLADHPSTRPDPRLVPMSEGKALMQKQGPASGEPFRVGADGLALSADGRQLYYSPLTSRHLYRVSADALADPQGTDERAAATVADLGDKGFAADGMLGDAAGRLYVTDFESGAVHRRGGDGSWEVIARGISWPDSLALLPDGTLLVTATQIQRSPRFQGKDRRVKPFTVYRVATDSRPLFLPATRSQAGAAAPERR